MVFLFLDLFISTAPNSFYNYIYNNYEKILLFIGNNMYLIIHIFSINYPL